MATNDVNFITWPIFQTNSRGPGVSFNTGLDPAPLLFSAKKSGSQVRVDFGLPLNGGWGPTTVPTNYTFSGPSSLVTNSVIFTPNDSFILLDVTGSFSTGTYTLILAGGTAKAANFDSLNAPGNSTFEVTVASGGGSAFNTGYN